MDFVTGLPIFTNWKSKTYKFILVIINLLTKIVYYESVKVTINALGLEKVFIDIVIRHYGLSKFIVSNYDLVFTS